MFSLILVLISIALVAALAAAAIYYGSTAYSDAQMRARAATVITQGQQILGATQAFRAEYGRWPTNLEELAATNYLSAIPAPPPQADASVFSLISTAYAATGATWETVKDGSPVYWVRESVPTGICRRVNLLALHHDGIHKGVQPNKPVQCFGENVRLFTVIISAAVRNEEVEDSVHDSDPDVVVDEDGGGWELEPTVREEEPESPPPPQEAVARLSDTALAFDEQAAKSGSQTKSVTVTNAGDEPLTILDTVLTKGDDFSVSNACSGEITPDQSCVIQVTFKPTVVGQLSDTLTVTASGSQPEQAVSLTGAGGESVGQVTTVGSSPTLQCAGMIVGMDDASGDLYVNSQTEAFHCPDYGTSRIKYFTATTNDCADPTHTPQHDSPEYLEATGLVVTRGYCGKPGDFGPTHLFVHNTATGTRKGILVSDSSSINVTMAASNDGKHLYAFNGVIFRADPVNLTVTPLFSGTGSYSFQQGGTVVDPRNPDILWAVSNGTLYRFDASTNALSSRILTGVGGGAAPFNADIDIYRRPRMDSTGSLYVAPKGTHAVARVNVDNATVELFAGSLSTSGSSDGIGTAARFSTPYSINISADERYIYVTDGSGGNRLRRIKIR